MEGLVVICFLNQVLTLMIFSMTVINWFNDLIQELRGWLSLVNSSSLSAEKRKNTKYPYFHLSAFKLDYEP